MVYKVLLTPQQRLEQFRKFIADHGHLPRQYHPAERSLYFWFKRVETGRARRAPADVAETTRDLVNRYRRKGVNPASEAACARNNAARALRTAQRTVEQAQAALDGKPAAKHQPVLRARVEHPEHSLAELAQTLGLTKSAYAARLRRALDHR